MAVAVVVNEGAASAPFAGPCDTGFVGDLNEHSVLVVVQAVLSVVGDIEVFPAVVVVVADANALSPARSGEAGLVGNVGECAVVVIAVEVIGRGLAAGKAFESGSIDQENVWPAIVVVVDDANAGAGSFDDVLLGIDAAEDVRRRQSGLAG